MKTLVLATGPAQFSQTGQLRGHPLKETDQEISKGIVRRLLSYAEDRAKSCGLTALLKGWAVEVYTMDGQMPRADWSYNVKWTNSDGLGIELCRIEMRNGWPFLDHKFEIENP